MADLLDQYENIVIGGGYRQRGFQSADADYQEPVSWIVTVNKWLELNCLSIFQKFYRLFNHCFTDF